MPFGLANAGSVYSRMLDVAMDKVERDFWTSYLDDILTFSTGPWIHFGHLSQVVRAHAAAVIKIQPCKSKLFQSKVEYLGHKISKDGVEMIPDYVRKVMNWPVPTDGSEVATFLGFTGYYRSFIPQYLALTNRLNGIKKAEKFVWNEETTHVWAVAFLQAVKDEMTQEQRKWLDQQQQAYDAYAAGAGPVAG